MRGTGLTDNVKGWVERPFTSDMDAWHWILFTGFVVVIAVLWTRVLKTLEI